MFEIFLEELSAKGGGVRAFDACARIARSRIADEPSAAAALLLISYVAQRFVESYDDQPLTMDAADEERVQFRAIIGMMEDAYASGSAEAKVEALNKVAGLAV